jgi:hypothetical protein
MAQAFPSPLRGGWLQSSREGYVRLCAGALLAVPSEATPSGRFAAISPSRGERTPRAAVTTTPLNQEEEVAP